MNDYHIQAITNFIFKEDVIKKSDIILIPGSSQKALAEKAAELVQLEYANCIIVSGFFNKKINSTEAAYLSKIIESKGINKNYIYEENKASNTLENALYSYQLIQEKNIKGNHCLLVCKNYHAMRAYLTYKSIFKNYQISVVPIMDDRMINKACWHRNEESKRIVLSEVEKIKKYLKITIN